jgi:hypothetical protein
MISTTLNRIKAHHPYKDGWKQLLEYLGKTNADNEPLSYSEIVKSNGVVDALWCCRAAPEHSKEWRLFAVWCARQVQHLMTDKRSINALDISEKYANGNATDKELNAAMDAAMDALDAFSKDAWPAARAAAISAARDPSWAVLWAALWAALWDSRAAKAAQEKEFLRIVGQ